MKVSEAIFLVALWQFAGSSEVRYEVPEPLFEAFSPKGLRVSLSDCRDVKSVEFIVSVPSVSEALIQEVNQSDGNHFIYWNPNVVVHLHDKIIYKLMVKHGDFYYMKEGTHVVQEVTPLDRSNDTDCSDDQGQKIISGFPNLDDIKDRHLGIMATGKASNFKSSYSSYKNSELKPITKSSTSTTSGTFYVKPSGVMEATGYKTGSKFDSTKREGEQWEHYQSELTAEELENMRQLYGSGMLGFPQLTSRIFPESAKVYEKNYMSSESQSFPGGLHTITYGQGPVTTHQFHQTHKTHESSSVSHSNPEFRFGFMDSSNGGSSTAYNKESEKLYKLEPLNKRPNPLPPQGTMFRATEYVREEHTVPVVEGSEVHLRSETQNKVVPQKIVQVSQSEDYSGQRQELVKPVFKPVGSTGRRGDQLEYNSGDLETIGGRQDYRSRHYVGSIFTSYTSSRPKSPQECSLVPSKDYSYTGNISEVERLVHELSCLASLAENSIKEEIALLKQKNGELSRKFELLEHEVKRLSANCNCFE